MRLPSRVAAALSAAAFALASRGAVAETKVTGFALDQFEPAPVGDALFGVPSPWVGGHLVPRAMLTFDFASRPFHLNLAGQKEPINIVASQGFLRLDASLALWDRLLVSADMPVAVVQSGQDPGLPGINFHPPSSPSAGDLRLGLRGRLFGAYRDPFQVGLGSYLFVPTGSPDAYAGEGAVRGGFHLLLGGRLGDSLALVWSAAGGVMLRGSGKPHTLTFGAGAALSIAHDLLQVGPELYGATQFGGSPFSIPNTEIRARAGTNLEVLFGLKVRVLRGLFAGAAAGPAPLGAIGSPTFRVVASLGWAPPPERAERAPEKTPIAVIRDRDDDGIRDDTDACPDVKGELQSDPTKDGCPLADRDKDGILDVEDACPGTPGQRSADATRNGCPPDTDEDGFADAADACPKEKGVASADPRKNGCPADRDGDGVADAADACPDTVGPKSGDPKWNGCPDDPDGDGVKGPSDACPKDKGVADPDPTQNGCPKLARLVNNEIVIKQQVQFNVYGKSRSDTVAPVSKDLMNEIRDVIIHHPEIVKIEVQGHTDDSGDDAYNQRLSEERAQAVRQWLIDAGIPADKLVAKGYGYTKPLADNRIRQGRQQNRRVQFVIVEKKP
jgi:OOP family OmpA-OmpF porin